MSRRSISYTVVDAFTSVPFQGNPAAVVIIDSQSSHAFDDSLLQKIAREFNLSETAFVTPVPDVVGTFGLRWFTPTSEIPLCGHATLASAHVLFNGEAGLVGPDIDLLTFRTKSGELKAKKIPTTNSSEGQGPAYQIELEFPSVQVTDATPAVAERTKAAFYKAFEVEGVNVHRVCVEGGMSFNGFALMEVDDSFDLEQTKIQDASPFKELAADKISGVIVTCSHPSVQNPHAQFISRVFAPAFGVPEDPVTGSAHCYLAPYWSERLGVASGEGIRARQVSPRGGDVDVVYDQGRSVVKMKGDSVIVHKGQMYY